MKIRFTPSRMDMQFSGAVDGDVIAVNGQSLDFSPLQDGGELPATAINASWMVGGAYRQDGEVYLTLICPHGTNAPYETRFPSNDYISVEGVIPFPIYDSDLVEEAIISDTPEAQ